METEHSTLRPVAWEAGKVRLIDQTALPGIYTATQKVNNVAVSQEVFAVNPSSERESDVRPRALTLAGQALGAPGPGALVSVQREFWFWLIPLVLLLLLFEWWWFHLRT